MKAGANPNAYCKNEFSAAIVIAGESMLVNSAVNVAAVCVKNLAGAQHR